MRRVNFKIKWPTNRVAVPTGNALAPQRSVSRENRLNFRPSSATEKVIIILDTNNHVKSEMLSNRHTHTHRPSTVTVAVHARRGLLTDRQTDRQTDTHTDTKYYNPRCACAPRVNKAGTKVRVSAFTCMQY